MISNSKSISQVFEESFCAVSLKKQIEHCNRYELTGLFRHYLPHNQPILEAGCGSGRWVAWFLNQGWKAAGIEWSQKLCQQAREFIPEARFECADMRAMPFADGEFSSIIALGSIEHIPEGPEPLLKEFYRVLRAGGIAIITVPYNGPFCKISRLFKTPLKIAKASHLLRRIFGRTDWKGQNLRTAKKQAPRKWASDFLCDQDGWNFYQYFFTKDQMHPILVANGFEIIHEFIEFGDEGIIHNFGRMAGLFDYENGCVRFTALGRLLRRHIPVNLMGLMLCYVVRKTSQPFIRGENNGSKNCKAGL